MADNDYDRDEEDLVPRSHIRDLEAKAKRATDLEAELEQTRREAAFAKALGNDAEHPGAKYFVKGYDGELNPEAIRAAAAEAGFLRSTPPPAPAPGQPAPDPMERIVNASSGADAPPPTSFEEAISQAKDQNEVLRITEQYHPGSTVLTDQG